jgi:hypothetical protein
VLPDIASCLKKGRVSFFLGAGFSAPLGYPLKEDLSRDLRAHFHNLTLESSQFDEIVDELLRRGANRSEIEEVVLNSLKPEEAYQKQNPYKVLVELIKQCPKKPIYIFTTNWDPEIENALREYHVLFIRGHEEISTLLDKLKEKEPDVILVKMHGDAASKKLVLTEKEALETLEERKNLYMYFSVKLAETALLIMGYSMLDQDIVTFYDMIRKGNPIPSDYLVLLGNSPFKNVTHFDEDVTKFLLELHKNLTGEDTFNTIPLKIDQEIKQVISQGTPLVISGCKYSGKTSLRYRLEPLEKYEVVDMSNNSTMENYRRLRSIVEDYEINQQKPPLIFLSHKHLEYFRNQYKTETGKDLFASTKNVNLQVTEGEAQDILKNCIDQKIYTYLAKHELRGKIIDHSYFSQGILPGRQYRTYLPLVIERLANQLNTNEEIKKAFEGSCPNETLINECFKKESGLIEKREEGEKALCEALVLPGAALFEATTVGGEVGQFLNKGVETLTGLLGSVSSFVPFVNLVGLGAAGVALLLGVVGWKKGKGDGPLWNLVKAPNYWNSLSEMEKKVIAYRFELKGSNLEPETGYDYLESLLGGNRSQELGQKIKAYFDSNPNVWEGFLNSDAGQKLNDKLGAETMKKLIETFETRFVDIEKKISVLETRIDEGFRRIEARQGIYREPEELGLRFVDGKWMVLKDITGDFEVEYVKVKKVEVYVEDAKKSLGNGGVVLFTGKQGVGKSLIARLILAELLQERLASHVIDASIIGDVKKEASYYQDKNAYPVVFLDPSPPKLYSEIELHGPGDVYVDKSVEAMRKKLEGQLNEILRTKIPSIIVIPDNIWEMIPGYLKKRLDEHDIKENFCQVPIELNSQEFINDIVKAYSNGCERLEGISERIIKFEFGYAIVSAYAGRSLRNNCTAISNVEEILERAKGNVKQFIKYYIRFFLLKSDEDKYRSFAFPLICRVWFGDMSRKLAEVLPEVMSERHLDSITASWISSEKEDLVLESLQELVRDSLNRNKEPAPVSPLTEMVNAIGETLDRLTSESWGDNINVEDDADFERIRRRIVNLLIVFINKLVSVQESGIRDIALLYVNVLTRTDYLYLENSNHSLVDFYLADRIPLPSLTRHLLNADKEYKIKNLIQTVSNKHEYFASKLDEFFQIWWGKEGEDKSSNKSLFQCLSYVAGFSVSLKSEGVEREISQLRESLLVLSLAVVNYPDSAYDVHIGIGRPIVDASTPFREVARPLAFYLWSLMYVRMLSSESEPVLTKAAAFLNKNQDWFVQDLLITAGILALSSVLGDPKHDENEAWNTLSRILQKLENLDVPHNMKSFILANHGDALANIFINFALNSKSTERRVQAGKWADFLVERCYSELENLTENIYNEWSQEYSVFIDYLSLSKVDVAYFKKQKQMRIDFARYNLARLHGDLNSAITFLEKIIGSISKEDATYLSSGIAAKTFAECLYIVRDGTSDLNKLMQREKSLREIWEYAIPKQSIPTIFKTRLTIWYYAVLYLVTFRSIEENKIDINFENLYVKMKKNSKINVLYSIVGDSIGPSDLTLYQGFMSIVFNRYENEFLELLQACALEIAPSYLKPSLLYLTRQTTEEEASLMCLQTDSVEKCSNALLLAKDPRFKKDFLRSFSLPGTVERLINNPDLGMLSFALAQRAKEFYGLLAYNYTHNLRTSILNQMEVVDSFNIKGLDGISTNIIQSMRKKIRTDDEIINRDFRDEFIKLYFTIALP